MSHQHATLEDTVYLGFVSNDTSGSGNDGATPLFDVRLAGAAASAAPVLSGTPDLLTHANYGPGCHEVAVAATAANGFAAGNTYNVFATITADSQTPGAWLGSFTLGPVPADLTSILGTALTETAGLIAAGFKKFFNVVTPTGTVNSLPDAVPGAAGGGFIAGTNAATVVTTSFTTTFTGNLSGSVGSVAGNVDGTVTLADGVTHGGSTALLRLGSSSGTAALTVENSGTGDAVAVTSTGASGNALEIASSAGAALNVYGSSGNVQGAVFAGSGTAAAFTLTGGATGDALVLTGGATSGDTISGSLTSGTDPIASIATILVNSAEIGAAGVGLSAVPWNAAWDAEVESEVNDALDTAITELGVAAPTATPTLRTGLMLLYMALRNKLVVQTSGTDAIEIHNNAGTKIAAKTITDDGSDYTEDEMA